jgi:hypothetical protein
MERKRKILMGGTPKIIFQQFSFSFSKIIWYNFGEMFFPSVNSTDFAIFCREKLPNLQ